MVHYVDVLHDDATGQQVSFPGGGMLHAYDGDRLRGKKTENGVTTYYLRSSVLGGQVVAEINASGVWMRGYVYLGGQLVALQSNLSVNTVHQDPVTKSQRITNSGGTVISTIDLDPWGGETGRSSNQAFQPQRYTSYMRDADGGDDAMHRRYGAYWIGPVREFFCFAPSSSTRAELPLLRLCRRMCGAAVN